MGRTRIHSPAPFRFTAKLTVLSTRCIWGDCPAKLSPALAYKA